MSDVKSNYDLLVEKLDQFIRKFYLNQLIRGTLYATGIILGLFIVFNLLEGQFYFDGGIRKTLFFGFIGLSVLALSAWVFLPLLKYFRLGKLIDHEQAAIIVGDHFGSVKDKLINILQLKKQSNSAASTTLITASINQKTEEIKLVPFKSAIDLKSNRKYLKYALPPALLLLVMLFAAPSLITEPTHRIINNGKAFEKDAPFHFKIENASLDVIQYDDLTINATVDGSVLPDEAFIAVDNFQYRMKKTGRNTFSYTFKNVQQNIPFNFFSGKVRSKEHELNVLLKAKLTSFDISLDYPSYTGRKDEQLKNTGDLLIPEGTKIDWNFEAANTDDIDIYFATKNQTFPTERRSDSRYRYSQKIYNNDIYKIYYGNHLLPSPDSVSYTLNVTKDQFPDISVESFTDSLENSLIYFIGNASDDYGLVKLNFKYLVKKKNGQEIPKTEIVSIENGRETQYNYTFDISTLELEPGDNVSYYFEIFDNDGVNGSKSSKTSIMEFKKPTIEEFQEKESDNEEDIKEKLKSSIDESKKIREELKKLREKLLQKKDPDWQDKKELEKLLERQKKLEEEINKAKEKFDENLKNQKEFSERPEELQKKQEQLKELFEEAIDEETKELMDKIKELMEQLNKEEMIQMMENFEMSEEAMEKNNERLLELFKTLEMEKEMQDMREKLEELAEKQEELAEETQNEEKPNEELRKEQEEINEDFEKLQEKLDEMQEKNKELERPKDLGEDTPEQMDDIQEDLEDSQKELQQNKNQKASEKQNNAAKKMKKMAQSMQESMESQGMEQMQEDIAAMRQLLENLVTLSFDQEELLENLNRTPINTPTYVSRIQEQFKLKDDFQLIQDSLQELAKRVSEIESFVTEKVVEVKSNLDKSIDQLEERQKDLAAENQRRTMKNVNDLALMLSESMQQMQQQMSGMMMGTQMCNKPGGSGSSGKVPMDKISEGQEGLNSEMKKMGEKGKNGEKGTAKEFAEAAAKQAALRKALEELQQEKMEQGKGSQQLQEIIDEMDKVEIDLVNKRLDGELMVRQQDILTRLLEAEKAERQREFDNQREAEIGKEKEKELPPALKEYLKERNAEIEMYKKVSPSLRPYYKRLVDEYYKALKNQ